MQMHDVLFNINVSSSISSGTSMNIKISTSTRICVRIYMDTNNSISIGASNVIVVFIFVLLIILVVLGLVSVFICWFISISAFIIKFPVPQLPPTQLESLNSRCSCSFARDLRSLGRACSS